MREGGYRRVRVRRELGLNMLHADTTWLDSAFLEIDFWLLDVQ
jgi:hypothetical protein